MFKYFYMIVFQFRKRKHSISEAHYDAEFVVFFIIMLYLELSVPLLRVFQLTERWHFELWAILFLVSRIISRLMFRKKREQIEAECEKKNLLTAANGVLLACVILLPIIIGGILDHIWTSCC